MKEYILKKIDKIFGEISKLKERIERDERYFSDRNDKLSGEMRDINKRLQALESSQSNEK